MLKISSCGASPPGREPGGSASSFSLALSTRAGISLRRRALRPGSTSVSASTLSRKKLTTEPSPRPAFWNFIAREARLLWSVKSITQLEPVGESSLFAVVFLSLAANFGP